MAFEALDELLDESLPLPIAGTIYRVPAPSAAIGLRTQALINAAAVAADGGAVDEQVLGDAAERDLYADVLGTAHGQMVDDAVPWPALKHAALTAMVWIAQDKSAAETFWNSGGAPSQAAPNRAQRRLAAASSTKSRGSTSGTSGRKAPARAAAKKAAPSR
ncbi:hypothetical protein GCM10010329_17370 [Streptomyces spiroverticillatus]|uniref:DUF7426 domain-containing protein n=1 Tax=Streptomyces finlayi TaxID=67296 RepID=A0A918WTM0_9ACTN|nr:hypothetical protein [Streptomyces finlayi]GGZ96667.1 hypothetical protein GCM10010329_17370 [Streptomyces spiroverticillatus]GHC81981.1 hypothetical protein GCM10010334_09850 [Streptomyces finlayi]